MGGNAWSHTGPYQQDLTVAFQQAQEETLARDNHGFVGRSVEELWRDPAWQEYIFTGGTCTVLDFPLMIDATDTDDGPFMRPLTDGEVRAWAPHPTHLRGVARRPRYRAAGVPGPCPRKLHGALP